MTGTLLHRTHARADADAGTRTPCPCEPCAERMAADRLDHAAVSIMVRRAQRDPRYHARIPAIEENMR